MLGVCDGPEGLVRGSARAGVRLPIGMGVLDARGVWVVGVLNIVLWTVVRVVGCGFDVGVMRKGRLRVYIEGVGGAVCDASMLWLYLGRLIYMYVQLM